MKKLLSLLAMTLMLFSLAGCMDDPDGSEQRLGQGSTGNSDWSYNDDRKKTSKNN
ncbi:MAG: hypothetical protein L3J75_12845 [Methylococcaceae bacterium]|nr:hypothetical protein [Methylococcaceae bacterium]